MSNNLKDFEDRAQRVSYAHKNTQRQYDEYPPKDDVVPIAAAINGWTLICGCYMGIEQTMNDPLPTCRGADIAMFRHRICYGGLIWNAAKGVFE